MVSFVSCSKVEVNGVLYDVPSKVRMASEVENRDQIVEEAKVEKTPPKSVFSRINYKAIVNEWQLAVKCVQLVSSLVKVVATYSE